MNSLQDKVVFFQGAGRWPAPLLVNAFAALGARVAACDMSPTLLTPLENAARSAGATVHAYIGDTSRGMPARALIDEVLADWGKIDILINNPRITPLTPMLEMDEYDWQRTIDANLNGPFLLTRLVARMMREQGQGVILNLVSASQAELRSPASAAAAASQAGLLALSMASARELIAYNIRVYAICLDETGIDRRPGSASPSPVDNRGNLTELALFLCSEAAACLPGQAFQVFHPDPQQE